MSEKANWSFKAQVYGGTYVAQSNDVELGTYVKSSVEVKSGTPLEVDFVAGPGLLVVRTDVYSVGGKTITYTVNGAGAAKKLDGPLVLIGAENVKLLDPAVTKLTFSNPFPDPITIELLTGSLA